MRLIICILGILLSLLFTSSCLATCLGLNCTCSVGATSVNFGSYDPTSGSPNNSTGTVSVTCSADVLGLLISYQINFNAGNSGSFAPRQMSSGSNTLNYNLYADSAKSQIWGDTTGGTVNLSDNYLLNLSPTTRNYTAYGQIPASQNACVGSYSDQITATVVF